MASALHESQLRATHDVLMNLGEDNSQKPFRQMAGQPAPRRVQSNLCPMLRLMTRDIRLTCT